MYGLEQGGITATIQYVLGLFDSETQDKLVKNVFLTGGPASIPGLKPRIERELLAMRPFESQFSVSLAKVGEIFPIDYLVNASGYWRKYSIIDFKNIHYDNYTAAVILFIN